MLVYAEEDVRQALSRHPMLDRNATGQLAKSLFPGENLDPAGTGDLSYTCPPDDELHIACYPRVSILAAKEFGIDHPSRLDPRFLAAGGRRTIYLHAMHSVVDWFACAKWTNGKLIRALSLSPDSGILENIGPPLPFEEPFWAGKEPPGDEYPFPFHPLELGEAALREFFGYQLEGISDRSLLDPASIPLLKYQRSKSRWKLW